MNIPLDDPRLTAYALGEMAKAERALFDELLSKDPEAQREVENIRATATLLSAEFQHEPVAALTDEQRQTVAEAVTEQPVVVKQMSWKRRLAIAASILIMTGLGFAVIAPAVYRASEMARTAKVEDANKVEKTQHLATTTRPEPVKPVVPPEVKEELRDIGYLGGDKKAAVPPAAAPEAPKPAPVAPKPSEPHKPANPAPAPQAAPKAAPIQVAMRTPQSDELAPLDIKLPKPMFVGTPKNIKSRNLETSTGEKRSPFMAPSDVTVISRDKPVTASDKDPVIGELKDITDGVKEGDDGSVVEFGPGVQWVQVDLGDEFEVFAIVAWHFHSQARVYHDVIVQISDDPDFVKDVKTIYNNDDDNSAKLGVGRDKEYVETSEGRLFDAKGATGRYVRLYSNGNTSNEMNHMIEVEVFGRPAAASRMVTAKAETAPLDIKQPKPMFVGTPKSIKSRNLEAPQIADNSAEKAKPELMAMAYLGANGADGAAPTARPMEKADEKKPVAAREAAKKLTLVAGAGSLGDQNGNTAQAPAPAAKPAGMVKLQGSITQPPQGADATGIKPYRIQLPAIANGANSMNGGMGGYGGGMGGYRGGPQGFSGQSFDRIMSTSETKALQVLPSAPHGAEAYPGFVENRFLAVADQPLSTFGIDVDTASYANVRRFLSQGTLPPVDAVRIEEMVNYFKYDYPQPQGESPFSVNVEVNACPWNKDSLLARIGIKGKDVDMAERPPCNLVFLLDVSGSMGEPNKLPLLVKGMKVLTNSLSPRDRVAIVTYNDTARIALDSTSCQDKDAIVAALDRLSASGCTNGAGGIEMAYDVARRNLASGGINRVILATDGDFNVGMTATDQLVQLIQQEAKSGVFFNVLGFGTGNLKDTNLQALADKGNGQYAYIDSFKEARRVLLDRIAGTLVTIAKDVKIQVEFNPARIGAYRLIGYEKRALAAKDFNDDTKDAGEIGSGHTVTALYELVPAGKPLPTPNVDPLKYQPKETSPPPANPASPELMTVKLRYKMPNSDTSTKFDLPVQPTETAASLDFKFASGVAAFGMVLRNSEFKGEANLDLVLDLAQQGKGPDPDGARAEFIDLVKTAKALAK